MNVVAELMETAAADTDVLRSLDQQGDRFVAFRNVDFLLRCGNHEKANLVMSFINDHSYGVATIQEDADVLVVIRMPVEQPILLSISGFFTCLAHIFDFEYDGWGCVAQPKT
jgi:hypothetical protein